MEMFMFTPPLPSGSVSWLRPLGVRILGDRVKGRKKHREGRRVRLGNRGREEPSWSDNLVSKSVSSVNTSQKRSDLEIYKRRTWKRNFCEMQKMFRRLVFKRWRRPKYLPTNFWRKSWRLMLLLSLISLSKEHRNLSIWRSDSSLWWFLGSKMSVETLTLETKPSECWKWDPTSKMCHIMFS